MKWPFNCIIASLPMEDGFTSADSVTCDGVEVEVVEAAVWWGEGTEEDSELCPFKDVVVETSALLSPPPPVTALRAFRRFAKKTSTFIPLVYTS